MMCLALLAFPTDGFDFHEERIFRSCSPGEGRADRVHGKWGPRVSLSVHGGPGARGWRRPAPREGTPEGGLAGTADGRGTRPRPDGHRRRPPARRSGTRERGGKGEAKGTVFGSPRSTATTETVAEAEEGGGAVRDDDDDGAPAVGGRNGDADGVDDDAATRMEVTPSREEDRSDDGGETELGGDGGERGARREHESDGESERRAAETEERSTGDD
uniref:Pr1-like protein n=2 Tax=Oryza sativa subsp. japonica TaxID=39947 RepID=Q651G9_ORYSJ|nr:pr1-like protein [Oryza sativa Japonica Group]BAD89366.1 pr1-like protein [Oryza sativa Japonica Group]